MKIKNNIIVAVTIVSLIGSSISASVTKYISPIDLDPKDLKIIEENSDDLQTIRKINLFKTSKFLDPKWINKILIESNLRKSLIEAIKKNDLDMVKKLIDEGAPVNPVNIRKMSGNEEGPVEGQVPLALAIKSGNYDIVEFLIKKGANVNEIIDYYNMRNFGSSMLQLSVYTADSKIKKLEESKIPFNPDDLNEIKILSLLLKSRANVDEFVSLKNLDQKTWDNIVKRLEDLSLEKYRPDRSVFSTLSAAIVSNIEIKPIVEMLIKYANPATINDLETNDLTPLMWATLWDRPVIIKLLLEHDADKYLRNKDGLQASDFIKYVAKSHQNSLAKLLS